MKTNTLALLASLAVLVTSAGAAQSQPQLNVVVLPTYTVSAPRYLPAEKKVNASLDEMRQQAQAPAFVATELSVFKAMVVPHDVLERAAQDAKAFRFAKL